MALWRKPLQFINVMLANRSPMSVAERGPGRMTYAKKKNPLQNTTCASRLSAQVIMILPLCITPKITENHAMGSSESASMCFVMSYNRYFSFITPTQYHFYMPNSCTAQGNCLKILFKVFSFLAFIIIFCTPFRFFRSDFRLWSLYLLDGFSWTIT